MIVTEIYIQLAGVQLGPYSEVQVREFVAEGLLSLTDKARADSSLEWVQVAELLSKAAPAATATAPAPDPNAVFVDAEPMPTYPAPAAAHAVEAAPETMAEQAPVAEPEQVEPVPVAEHAPEPQAAFIQEPVNEPAPVPTPVSAHSEPEIFEADETPRPVPLPEPPVVVRPARPAQVYSQPPIPTRSPALSRRLTGPVSVPTHLLAAAPTGEPRTSPENVLSGTTVKTKPLGPVAPVTPQTPLRPAKTATSSKALSTTSPLMSSTRRMSRTAMARELQDKPTAPMPRMADTGPTAPPSEQVPVVAPGELEATTGPMAKGVNPTATPVVVHSPPAAEVRKGGGISSLLRSITAKTVPMRGSNLPPGATPPTIMTPPPEAESGRGSLPVTTPLPTRSIINPAVDRSNRAPRSTPTPAPAPVAAPVSEPALEVPTEKLPASKKAEELRAKAAKRAAEREALELDLPKTAPLPKPPVAGKAKPAKATPANEEAEEEADDEPKVPRARRRPPVLLALCGMMAVAGAYYAWSPYHASGQLRDAFQSGAASDLERAIDFPTLRTNLKQEASTLSTNTGAALTPAASSALEIVDKSIDTYVTPGGVADLVPKPRDDMRTELGQIVPPSVIGNIVNEFIAQPVRSEGFRSPTDFVLQTDVASIHLSPEGLGWKLTRIDVRPDLPALSGVAGAPLALVPVVQSHLNHGRKASAAGKYDLAIEEYSQALAIAPQSTIALLARGSAYLTKGQVPEAIKDFTDVLTIDPQSTAAYNDRGNARIGKGDIDGAIRDFSEAIRIDPTLAISFDYRGCAKTAKNDLDGAIQDFTQAIALDPNLASAYSDRGLARQANGNLEGAIKDYTDALALQPKSPRTYLSRGIARLSQNNLPAAILDFDHAVALDPKLADAYFQRGNAKSAMHDTDGAIADFSQTIALDPKNALAYCSRAVAREDKGDLDGAKADYSQTIKLDPRIAVAFFRRALIEVRENDPDDAIADATQSIELDPKNGLAYYYRGFSKFLRGNYDGATSDLRLFIEAAPRDRFADNAHLYLWLLGKLQNVRPDADQELSDTLANSWNHSADDLTARTAGFLLGRSTEADYFTMASSSDSDVDATQHCQAYYFAGMKRLLMGDKGTASDYFQKCLATGKKDFCEYILAQAELQQLTAPPVPPVQVPALGPTPALTPQPGAASSAPPASAPGSGSAPNTPAPDETSIAPATPGTTTVTGPATVTGPSTVTGPGGTP